MEILYGGVIYIIKYVSIRYSEFCCGVKTRRAVCDNTGYWIVMKIMTKKGQSWRRLTLDIKLCLLLSNISEKIMNKITIIPNVKQHH